MLSNVLATRIKTSIAEWLKRYSTKVYFSKVLGAVANGEMLRCRVRRYSQGGYAKLGYGGKGFLVRTPLGSYE